MASELELCLIQIKQLERRIENLEYALSRVAKQRPAPRLQVVGRGADVVVSEEADEEPAFPALLVVGDDDNRLSETIRVDTRAALEDIPRVMHRIRMMWFYPECEGMLDKLIIDDRGNRAGFSREVMEELLFLASLSRAVKMHSGFAKASAPKRVDIWQEHRPRRPEK